MLGCSVVQGRQGCIYTAFVFIQLCMMGEMKSSNGTYSHAYSVEDGAVIEEDQTPPPEYHYNEELLNRSLYEPGRRSRLITL